MTQEQVLNSSSRDSSSNGDTAAGGAALGAAMRANFPVFEAAAQPIAYLDTAASSLKPRAVVDTLAHYLLYEHANIHRGAYELSAHATQRYDAARERVARFINAPSADNVVFTKGTTEAINLVSYSFQEHIPAQSTVLLTLLEHHSNIVPWQLLAERQGVQLVFAEIQPNASLDVRDLCGKLEQLTPALLGITHVANSFGSVNDISAIIEAAHAVGTRVLVDAAQSIAHKTIDVQELDADFLVFSGHKLYGPTGIGVLYAKQECLEQMKPFQGGGDMIVEVTVERSTWAEPPQRFEAGTPPIAEAIALGTAIDFVEQIGRGNIAAYENELHRAAFKRLSSEPGVICYGPATSGEPHESILAFNVEGVHPHDFSTVADSVGVQVRSGHHCAMPALSRLGLQATVRASLGVYSTEDDIELLCKAIHKAKKLFGG